MKNICRRSFIVASLAAFVFSTALSLQARPPKSEDELIADLGSPKDSVVTSALQNIEKNYPTTTKALPAMKKLLADPRPAIQRKSARVLGAIHADVDSAYVKNICELLKASDKREIMDGLIALRGLKAQSAIPQIVPLLDNPDSNVKRDACRTLAVLGDKNLIPKIQPLLTFPDLKVQEDAASAITLLKAKS